MKKSKDDFFRSLPSDVRRFLESRSFNNLLNLKNVKAKIDHLYTNEFFNYLKTDFLKIPLLTPRVSPTFDEKESILSNFKEFQTSRNVKFLARAISIYPYLLEQEIIRLKVESIIFSKKNNKKYRNENLNLFLEGLQYNYNNRQYAFSDSFIKRLFEITHLSLSSLFKEHKPRTNEDIANIIKKLLPMRKVLFFDNWCEIWAREKQPRRIALRIVQFLEAHERDDSFLCDSKTRFNPPHRIGINELSKIVAHKKSI